MKLTLKLLLLVLAVFVAFYASFPAWFPQLLRTQLPAGWELEKIDTAYPGTSGIQLNSLQIKSQLQTATISLSASDISFNYRSFCTRVNSITLDVFLNDADNSSETTMTLDDLTLPVMNLSGEVPALSVSSLRMRLHQATTETLVIKPARPLVLDFGSLNLVPGPDDSYHLDTEVSLETLPVAPGRIEVHITPHLQSANMHFPADLNASQWLSVSAEHDAQETRIQAIINTEAIDHQWMDSILQTGSGGQFRHMDGQVRANAKFAGTRRHKIQQLSLVTDKLELQATGASVELRASLLAKREQEKILVSLQDSNLVRYRDETGKVDRLIQNAIPEFQRVPRSGVEMVMSLESGSRFAIQPGDTLAIRFNGDIDFGLESRDETISLKSKDITVAITDFPDLETMTIDGLVHLEWNEHAAVQFAIQDLPVNADGFSASAEITSINSNLVSAGHVSLSRLYLADMGVSIKQMDLHWQDLDLLNRNGRFLTQTHGFNYSSNGDTWTGFDFDLNYHLLNGEQIDGFGTMAFGPGPELPLEFNGNISPASWKISFPPSSIKATHIAGLLKTAKLNLPANLKLDSGLLGIQGNITVDNAIKADMAFTGNQFGASIKETRVNRADFDLKATLNQDISVIGPVSIEEISLAGGIDLAQFSAGLSATGADLLTMEDIRADVLEGQLKLARLRYSNGEIADTRADFTHVNLERLLAFANIDGLSGTGYLDLSLPISQKPSGVVISSGKFHSTGSGRLSYAKEGVTAVNIGMQALENFHYKQLSGTIDYTADGEYRISLRLEGSNPDLYDGYPVIFNLNITGVMPALFESMFITGSFEEAILKQIKSR